MHIYIYIHTYVCVCVCVRERACVFVYFICKWVIYLLVNIFILKDSAKMQENDLWLYYAFFIFRRWSCFRDASHNLYIYIYIYICLYHVPPLARVSLTLSPPLPIVHCFRQVFRATSHIGTELPYVGSG